MAEDTKECPFCGEEIKAKAIYCRYCGHYLDGRELLRGWMVEFHEQLDCMRTYF